MTLSEMKNELHDRLWQAQQRWFDRREEGLTKRELKLQGLREHGDLFHETRSYVFTGCTRVTYERELKRFVQFAHDRLGRTENRQINHRDFHAYVDYQISRGLAAKELHKIRSAIAKFGALYGKSASFHAASAKLGKRIRALVSQGHLPAPHRPRVTPQVRHKAIELLRTWDQEAEQRTGEPRGYHLALSLQKEAGLRSIEATQRFVPSSLVQLEGAQGLISVLGKGGRVRQLSITPDLYRRLEEYFQRSGATRLASLRPYREALRRATLAVGGRSTGSHAQRRTAAVENKNRQYGQYVHAGLSPAAARKRAVEDTVEMLGHSRSRRDLAKAYM